MKRPSRRRVAGRFVAVLLVIGGLLAAPAVARAANPNYLNTPTGTWMVNGPVRAFAQDGNVLWIGGQFTTLSDRPATKPGAQTIPVSNLVALNATTGEPIP